MLKAVIFDLDNTLYDENLYFLKVFEQFSKKYNLDYNEIKDKFNDEFRLSSKDIFTDILKEIDFYSEEKQNELFDLYKNIECKLDLENETFEVLDFINKCGLKTAIITNGVLEAQKNKVKVLGIEDKFDFIIYAREFGKGYEKPSPKAFNKALDLLKVNVSEALYIGDHPNTDIKGAQKIGLKVLWYLNGYASKIDYEYDIKIKDLSKIKDFIKEF